MNGHFSRRHLTGAVASLLILGLALWASVRPIETTIQLACITEIVTAELPIGRAARWGIYNALITLPGGDLQRAQFSGTVTLTGPIAIDFVRIAGGPLLVQLLPKMKATILLEPERGTSPLSLSGGLVIRFEEISDRLGRGESIVFDVPGIVSLGAIQPFTTHRFTPLLRECNVQMLGSALGTNRMFVGAQFHTSLGETVAILPGTTIAHSILVVNENPAINAAVRVRGDSLQVNRVGSVGYRLELTLFDRCIRDPLILSLWSVGALLAGWFLWMVEKSRRAPGDW